MAEKVLNNKIDDLNKQLVELNNIKEVSDVFNQSKKNKNPLKNCFQLINKRYEKHSTIIATNKPFGKWY